MINNSAGMITVWNMVRINGGQHQQRSPVDSLYIGNYIEELMTTGWFDLGD